VRAHEILRQVATIAMKDVRAELRTKEAINASLAFALMILLLFSYTFDPEQEMMRQVSGGLLWIVFAFAGTLTLNRSFARELPNDCLDALIAAPIPGSALFLGKCFASFVLVLAVELVSLPVFGIFYNVHWTPQFPALFWRTPAGNLGAHRHRHHFQRAHGEHQAARSHAADAHLPHPDARADGGHAPDHPAGQRPADPDDDMAWLKMLIGFDVVFTAVSLALVETVLVG
jgi:heme exporter protein B